MLNVPKSGLESPLVIEIEAVTSKHERISKQEVMGRTNMPTFPT
jgi:hypothetical protein